MTSYHLSVYVPRAGHPGVGHIDPGSGVVGLPLNNDRVAIHYEGNRYGAIGLERFADRTARAAERLRFGYPTVAKTVVPEDSLVEVGRYDGVEGRVEIADEDAKRELCRWLGVEQLDPDELQRSESRTAPA